MAKPVYRQVGAAASALIELPYKGWFVALGPRLWWRISTSLPMTPFQLDAGFDYRSDSRQDLINRAV